MGGGTFSWEEIATIDSPLKNPAISIYTYQLTNNSYPGEIVDSIHVGSSASFFKDLGKVAQENSTSQNADV